MKPTRIENMVEEFKDKFGVTYGGQETQDEWLRKALTKIRQETLDEAVRVVNKEIAIHTQLMGEWTGISFTDAGIRRNKTNPHQEKVETLNEVLKALQDKK